MLCFHFFINSEKIVFSISACIVKERMARNGFPSSIEIVIAKHTGKKVLVFPVKPQKENIVFLKYQSQCLISFWLGTITPMSVSLCSDVQPLSKAISSLSTFVWYLSTCLTFRSPPHAISHGRGSAGENSLGSQVAPLVSSSSRYRGPGLHPVEGAN